MRRSSTKLWSEMSKELSRLQNLVWVVALLVWLGFTSSWYSRWHSYNLHTTWHSLTRAHHPHFEKIHWKNGFHEHQQHHESSLSTPSPSSDTSNLLAPPKQDKIYRQNDLPMASGFVSPIEDGLNVSIARADHAQQVYHLDISERKEEQQDDDEPQQFRRSKEQNAHEGTNYQATNEVPNDGTRSVDPPKTCASVEEMGVAAAGNVAASSLRVRRMIENYFAEHGALHVRELPAEEFCHRGFVYGRAAEDGLGNEIYKILTASGLSIMLNRSLIIAEHGSTNPAYFGLTGRVRLPFGDYLKYSNQTFSISEVKQLWVKHDCAGAFRRPLIMRIDDFQRPTRTKVFCEDWTKWKHPIIWFKGTADSNALQFFLKNRHPVMRSSASLLFGDASKPFSRPNAFGELFQAFISPMPVIEEAVQWALQGVPDPDLSIHMRMLNSRSRSASHAVCSCIRTVVKNVLQNKTLPQVVIVSDTPFIIKHVKEQLQGFAEVVHFNYELFMRSHHNLSKVMMGNYFQPPEKRVRDWGSMPRWVAIVDLFLASRAKSAVISGANRRVGTTYAQLIASLAAAMRMDEQGGNPFGFGFYSSFQSSLLAEGLAGQRGWGHTWRRFGGPLSCKNQTNQCAETPLLPYAWWDGPWQSPVPRDAQRLLAYGIKVSGSGEVEEDTLAKTCELRKTPIETLQLLLPSCKRLKLCHQ